MTVGGELVLVGSLAVPLQFGGAISNSGLRCGTSDAECDKRCEKSRAWMPVGAATVMAEDDRDASFRIESYEDDYGAKNERVGQDGLDWKRGEDEVVFRIYGRPARSTLGRSCAAFGPPGTQATRGSISI